MLWEQEEKQWHLTDQHSGSDMQNKEGFLFVIS